MHPDQQYEWTHLKIIGFKRLKFALSLRLHFLFMSLSKERYYSLDVFRGATIAFMIMVNNPGSWSYMYEPLKHAPWHGVTPTDLVFPFFLFAVGNAMAFVIPRMREKPASVFWKKVIKRTLLIFLIGLFLNWSPFIRWSGDELVFRHWVDPNNPESGIRIFGVLQRIAVAYFFAAVIAYFASFRTAVYISLLLLLAYWVLLYVGGTAGDPYSLEGFLGTRVDKAVLGVAHMYKGEGVPFDPEGIVSSVTGISQVLFGYFAGVYIREKGKNFDMLSHLLLAGVALWVIGMAWGTVFPINKKIWTSSYVLYTTGLALMLLGFLIYLIEFQGKKGWWSSFFDDFGKNPLFIFVLSGFLPRVIALFRWQTGVNDKGEAVYTSLLPWLNKTFIAPIGSDPRIGSLLYSVLFIIAFWAIAHWMNKQRIYIKV